MSQLDLCVAAFVIFFLLRLIKILKKQVLCKERLRTELEQGGHAPMAGGIILVLLKAVLMLLV